MTESQRTWGLRGLMLVVAAGLVAWLASCTEWAEVEVPVPPRGEAARNRFYVTEQLVQRLGGTVATPNNLATLPPPGATLVLTSWHWDLFPDRARRLRDWVEAGGHLVLFADTLDHEQLKDWLPIRQQEPPRRKKDEAQDDDAPEDEEEDEDDAPAGRPAPTPTPALLRQLQMPCRTAHEPEGVPPHFPGGERQYELCGVMSSGWKLLSPAPARWSLDGRDGPLLLRAAQGRGEVTVIQPWGLLDNTRVLKGDNALAVVAALKAGPGTQVWFVSEEARPSLLAWLWREASAVVLLGAAALVLALWRGARRFGPLAARALNGRRSMGEQIAGTAQFLRHQGPDALLSAQIRALEAAARLHVRDFDKLDRTQRAAAIARHTGLDAAALGLALDKSLARRRTDLPATLELLETARRLLSQKKPAPRSPAP